MKILYLMHVDWNWIKQRPHFIAEKFNERGFEVDLYFKKNPKISNVNQKKFETIKPIPSIRGQRFSFIKNLNLFIYNVFLYFILKKKSYDYIYITHPSLYSNQFKNKKIIYDCMDDIVAFSNSSKRKQELLFLENRIISKAEIVLFSSNYLSEVVIKRAGKKPKKYNIINNAIEVPENPIIQEKKVQKVNEQIDLTYIGTISEWFDFELLNRVQEKYKSKRKLNFNLYGPLEISEKYEFVNFKGSVPHAEIFDVMDSSDILIMPFLLTDLIKSVNPVKLYEYIYSGKPVICLRYGETEKFQNQVYLYEPGDEESFIKQLDEIEKNGFKGKLSAHDAQIYVKNNTWKNRVEQIVELL